MNFLQLKYFTEVARHGSLSRASVTLRIAQPAITRQVGLLERELGIALLTRHARGVALTAAGTLLLKRSEVLLRGLEQTRVELRDLSDEPSGTLRIGCTPALMRAFMIKPLYKFLTRYPKVNVLLQEGISDRLCQAVLKEDLDAAIISSKLNEPNLRTTPLFNEEIWLFGPVGGKRFRSPVALETIADLPMLLARRTQTTREIIERRMAKAGRTMNVLVETDSIQTIQGLILQGLGYTVAPYSGLSACISDKTMRGVPIKDFTIGRSLIRRADIPVTRALHEFGLMIEAEVSQFTHGHRCLPGFGWTHS